MIFPPYHFLHLKYSRCRPTAFDPPSVLTDEHPSADDSASNPREELATKQKLWLRLIRVKWRPSLSTHPLTERISPASLLAPTGLHFKIFTASDSNVIEVVDFESLDCPSVEVSSSMRS